MVTEEAKQRIVDILMEEVTINSISTDLARQAEQYTTKIEVPEKYQQHERVFSEEAAQRFPPKRPWDHAIELKPEAPNVIDCKIYPLTQTEDQALVAFLDEQLKKGYIRPSKSPYTSPFFFIKKKDRKLRPVQDYRKLNKHTIRNRYLLPFIPDLISQVQDAHIFTKFDVRWGYNNIRIKAGDEEKAAFKTKYGLFEPRVMFFGLTNSPSTFQTMMNQIFKDIQLRFLTKGTRIIIYMDNILIATSTTLIDHSDAVHAVLDLLREHDLYLKPEKCVWEATSIDYLGVILEKGMTRMDPTKISGIKDWPLPKTVTDVRSFLGFCNFYQAFIRGFANIARPLNQLTKKEQTWEWTDKQQRAFDALRTHVTEEPVLSQPELDKPFKLEVDASGFALGTVLLQQKEDNKRHLIGYYSSTLSEAEQNYDIYDLELLAIVKALRNWRPFLASSPHIIMVFTDHANLQYWRQPHKISHQITQEVAELAEYNVILRHIPGKANGRADALSRRPDYNQGTRDNENITVLPDHMFIRTMTIETPQYEQQPSLIRKWVDAHRLKEFHGRWYKDGHFVITGDLGQKRMILRSLHDAPTTGHPGIARTREIITRHYWWPQMAKDIEDYVKGCAQCQQNKVNTQGVKTQYHPITTTAEALHFQTIALYFITKLPKSKGYDTILTITDQGCTKMALFIPCNEEIMAEQVAYQYLINVFNRFGLPTKVISDRDTRFTSKFIKDLCKCLGIAQNISTAYHPRTDGQSERTNQWLEQYLRFWTNVKQMDWATYLPIAEFVHNSWYSETTRTSPFHSLMGYNPRATWEVSMSSIPQVNTWLEQMMEARQLANEARKKSEETWKHSTKRPQQQYKEGDQVWLEGTNIHTYHPMAKLAPKQHGPFQITKVLGPVTYQLRLLDQ